MIAIVTLTDKILENPPVVGSYRLDKIFDDIPIGSDFVPRNFGITMFLSKIFHKGSTS